MYGCSRFPFILRIPLWSFFIAVTMSLFSRAYSISRKVTLTNYLQINDGAFICSYISTLILILAHYYHIDVHVEKNNTKVETNWEFINIFFVLFLLAHIIESIGIYVYGIWWELKSAICILLPYLSRNSHFSTIITEGNKITCLLAFSLAIFFVKNNWNTAGVNVNMLTTLQSLTSCSVISLSLSHTHSSEAY